MRGSKLIVRHKCKFFFFFLHCPFNVFLKNFTFIFFLNFFSPFSLIIIYFNLKFYFIFIFQLMGLREERD